MEYAKPPIGLLVLVLAALTSCQNKQIDRSNPVGSQDAVSYTTDIQPLISMSCSGSGCHIGTTTSGVNLSNWTAMLSSVGQQYGKNIVIPGDAAGSPLIDKITPSPDFGLRMPQGRSPLSGSEIRRFSDWIDEGASNN